METGRQRGTAFTIGFGGGGHDTKASAAKKPGGKGPFKFLRKDEGHRVTSAHDTSDASHEAAMKAQRAAQDSAALRNAIAADMRKRQAQQHDPFADAVVAVPKRGPPAPRSESQPAPPRDSGERSPASGDDEAEDTHVAPPPTSARVQPAAQNDGPRNPPATARREAPPNGNARSRPSEAETVPEAQPASQPRPQSRLELLAQRRSATVRPKDTVEQPPAATNRSNTTAPLPARAAFVSEDPPLVQRTQAPRQQSRVPVQTRDDEDLNDGVLEEQREDERSRVPAPRQQQQHRHFASEFNHEDDDDNDRARANYFRNERSQQPPAGRPRPPAQSTSVDEAEQRLLDELDREIDECRKEKAKLRQQVLDVQREKQRLQQERDTREEDLQKERDEFEQYVAEERRQLRKERREVDDLRRQASQSSSTEKETIRRLQSELNVMREGIEKLQAEMKDREKAAKADGDRLRREVVDLTARNSELMATVKKYQAAELGRPTGTTESAYRAASAGPGARGGAREVSPSTSTPIDSDAEYQTGGPRRSGLAGAPLNSQQRKAEEDMRKARIEKERRLAAEQRRREEEQRLQEEAAMQRQSALTPRGGRRAPAAEVHADPSVQQQRSVPTVASFLDDEPLPPEDIPNDSVIARNTAPDGKSERMFQSGKREVHYTNGTRKVILPTGHVILYFANGDIKRSFPTGKSTYWYAAAQTTHTQFPNGTQLFQFHEKQQYEKHHPDGSKEIMYPEGIYKYIRADGTEDTLFPEGFTAVAPPRR